MNIIIKCDSKYYSNITRLWNEHHNTQYHTIARFWTSQYIKYIFRFIEYNKVLSMYFSVLSLLGKGRGLKGVEIWITSKKEYFAPVWLILAHRFWRRRFFLISSMYFRYFIIISLWKRAHHSFVKLLSPLLRGTLYHICLKLDYRFWRRRFLDFINIFSHFESTREASRFHAIMCIELLANQHLC